MEVHMEKDKKVTALYCRLSKDDGSNSESLSIRTQKSMLMEYATRNGFGNCQYYVDDGYSGTNSDRPAFQELLDDIREGKVATVITKDQSRLGRNHIETGTYMEIFFPEHGVRYIAINDGYDSNEQSQMDIAPFRNIINEMYAKDTSRKIKSALRTRKKTSVYKGYKQDKIEMRGDRAEMSDFPLYLNTVAGGLDRRDQTIGGFSFVVKIYAVPVVEIIGQLLYLLGRYGFNTQFSDCL